MADGSSARAIGGGDIARPNIGRGARRLDQERNVVVDRAERFADQPQARSAMAQSKRPPSPIAQQTAIDDRHQ